jgi:hypothetical protein
LLATPGSRGGLGDRLLFQQTHASELLISHGWRRSGAKIDDATSRGIRLAWKLSPPIVSHTEAACGRAKLLLSRIKLIVLIVSFNMR